MMACKKLPLPQIVADAGNGAQALVHVKQMSVTLLHTDNSGSIWRLSTKRKWLGPCYNVQ